MSEAIGAVSANVALLRPRLGDPVKNDASEAWSLLQKMDPERYADREAFLRRYGGDTLASKEALQRELARHSYSFALKPDVDIDREERKVAVSEVQSAALATLEANAAALRIAAMEGKANIDAARALSPHLFEGVPESAYEAIAHKVAKSVGIIKNSAVRRILDNHPASAKLSELSSIAAERKGKQGVVFAHSLEAVEAIAKRLEGEGHRVIRLTGADSSADKAAKLRAFKPAKGEPEADIVVASDAGSTGADMQSGSWLAQYDTPDTAMTHAQRNGRIARIGQTNNVELLDLVSDHPAEARNRERLSRKYGLRDMLTSPLDGIDDTGLAFYLKQSGAIPSAAQAALL
jgi:superfamily II DNA or RNA helicase